MRISIWDKCKFTARLDSARRDALHGRERDPAAGLPRIGWKGAYRPALVSASDQSPNQT